MSAKKPCDVLLSGTCPSCGAEAGWYGTFDSKTFGTKYCISCDCSIEGLFNYPNSVQTTT